MTYDDRDITVAEQLGGIKKAIEIQTTSIREMKEAWERRIVQRDAQQDKVNERLASLEKTRAEVDSSVKTFRWLAGIGFLGVLAEWFIRIFLK